MNFHDLVQSARSCRRFQGDAPLSVRDLEWLTDCARISPCARNAQELRFVLVSSEKSLDALFPLMTWAGALKDWKGPVQGERPTGYIIILAPDKESATQGFDVGIAAQTINLACSSRGWGCCPIFAYNHSKLPEVVPVPAGYKATLILALGVARETRRIDNVEAKSPLVYYRDADSIHHVPKLPLEALITARI